MSCSPSSASHSSSLYYTANVQYIRQTVTGRWTCWYDGGDRAWPVECADVIHAYNSFSCTAFTAGRCGLSRRRDAYFRLWSRATSSSWQLPLDRSVSTPCLLPHQPWNAGVRQFLREFYVHAFPLKHCSTFSRFVSEWVSSAGTWHVMADLSEAVKCISTGQQTHHNQHNTEHNTDCAKTLTQQVSAVSNESARRGASRQTCCKQRWTLSVINLRPN